MQEELLEKHPDAKVKVYALWFSMYPTDRREDWPAEVLDDARVEHFWDEEKTVGTFYMDHLETMDAARADGTSGITGAVLWDAYLVYGPDARWEGTPPDVRRWGRTILRTQDGLTDAFGSVVLTTNDTQ